MKITRHATKRIRQRVGVRKKEKARKLAHEAFENGNRIEQLPDKTKEYIDESYTNADIIVYKNYVYVFDGKCLITVLNLPQDLHFNNQDSLYKKKKAELSGRICWNCKETKFNEIFYKDKNQFQLECFRCGTRSKIKGDIRSCENDLISKMIRYR